MPVITVVAQLDSLARRLDSVARKLRTTRIRPSGDQLATIDTLAHRLTESVRSVAQEVKKLKQERYDQLVAVGASWVAQARSVKDHLDGGQVKSSQLKKSLALIFLGPNDSGLDSEQVRSRKRLTRSRCQTIRQQPCNLVLLWATAFHPSVWTADGGMATATFDYLLKALSHEAQFRISRDIYNYLTTLRGEEPLHKCDEYSKFMDAVIGCNSIEWYDSEAVPPGHETPALALLTGGPGKMPLNKQNATNLPMSPRKRRPSDETVNNSNDGGDEDPASNMIETAFLLSPREFHKIWERYESITAGESHSIILTIPVEDRVASIVLSIPRPEAIDIGSQFKLPMIFQSVLA